MTSPRNEQKLRQHLRSIAGDDRLEQAKYEMPSFIASAQESVRGLPPEPAIETAQRAVDKIRRGEPLDAQEMYSMEAIVLPKERPVVFIQNNSYQTPESPWQHFSDSRIRTRLEAALPSIGRVELPDNLSIPYGGTAFVVGPNLLMTNRHVAELFARGLGSRVAFRSGQSAAWDYVREHNTPVEPATTLNVERLVMIHPFWDMALLEVSGLTARQQPLVLGAVDPRQLEDHDVAVIGYPAKDLRNDLDLQDRIFQRTYNVKRLQPGKLKARGSVGSFGNMVSAVTHDSSTLGGNSGSAVVDVQTGAMVALHFAGRYLEANFAVPVYELARDPRVVAAGVNFSGDRAAEDPVVTAAWQRIEPEDVSPHPAPRPQPARISPTTARGQLRFTIGGQSLQVPIEFAVSEPGGVESADFTEGMKIPFIAPRLDSREGFDPKFLDLDGGEETPLPVLTDAGKTIAAHLDGGSHELKYHKFSICMHKLRRLALFTASNVDWRDNTRRVNGRLPTRKQLNGFTSDASERWVTDERIPQTQQLPDRFYTKDGGAFNKGHLVRRNDVTWGHSFADMHKANGDTFHTTNCSPQTAEFNQSSRGEDNWGDLENLIARQTENERAVVLSGPVLDDADLRFEGFDDRGEVHIQIPSRFWKLVVVKGFGGPEVYGFVQEQDLSDVPLEFAVPRQWLRQMKSIETIERLLFGKAKLDWYKKFDQFESPRGERVRRDMRR